jgi:hypothetical protein
MEGAPILAAAVWFSFVLPRHLGEACRSPAMPRIFPLFPLVLLHRRSGIPELRGYPSPAGGAAGSSLCRACGSLRAWEGNNRGGVRQKWHDVRQTTAGVLPWRSCWSPLAPTTRQRLLIRLFQQAPSGSVGECSTRHFRRPCPSFNRSLPTRKRASSIWPLVAGRMASCVALREPPRL